VQDVATRASATTHRPGRQALRRSRGASRRGAARAALRPRELKRPAASEGPGPLAHPRAGTRPTSSHALWHSDMQALPTWPRPPALILRRLASLFFAAAPCVSTFFFLAFKRFLGRTIRKKGHGTGNVERPRASKRRSERCERPPTLHSVAVYCVLRSFRDFRTFFAHFP